MVDSHKVKIDYTELYDLLGQLLTLNDAVMGDLQQRAANKQFIKRVCYGWIENLYKDQHGKGDLETPKGIDDIQPYDPGEESGETKARDY